MCRRYAACARRGSDARSWPTNCRTARNAPDETCASIVPRDDGVMHAGDAADKINANLTSFCVAYGVWSPAFACLLLHTEC